MKKKTKWSTCFNHINPCNYFYGTGFFFFLPSFFLVQSMLKNKPDRHLQRVISLAPESKVWTQSRLLQQEPLLFRSLAQRLYVNPQDSHSRDVSPSRLSSPASAWAGAEKALATFYLTSEFLTRCCVFLRLWAYRNINHQVSRWYRRAWRAPTCQVRG